MSDQILKSNAKRRPFTVLAGGCLGILYLALCVFVIFAGRTQFTVKNSPTPTIAATSVPKILAHMPTDQKDVIHEDFSSNRRNWGLYFPYGKLEVINGKLILQSNVPNTIALGTSQDIALRSEKYYVQADFTTDAETPSSFGLIFGLNRSLVTYYVFELWPQAAGFRLFKYNSGKWTELVPYSRAEVNPYPQANTLSVFFDRGQMELSINGKLVSQYSDKDFFQSKDVGVYIANPGYRLLVDDLFVFDEK